jgi:hypothetical protein
MMGAFAIDRQLGDVRAIWRCAFVQLDIPSQIPQRVCAPVVVLGKEFVASHLDDAHVRGMPTFKGRDGLRTDFPTD